MTPLPRLAVLSLFLPFALSSSLSQAPPKNGQPPELANDPEQFLRLAEQQNGLGDIVRGKNGAPWHVRITWQMLKGKGRPEEQGTWEEWWSGPHQWERSYDSPDYQQTTWGTPQGNFELNPAANPDWTFSIISASVFYPIQVSFDRSVFRPDAVQLRESNMTLKCVVTQNFSVTPPVQQYCFDVGMNDLRRISIPEILITLNSIVKFQGHYMARDITVSRLDMPTIEIHLDAIDEPNPSTAGQTPRPSQATMVPGSSPAPHKAHHVIPPRLLKMVYPDYPVAGVQMRAQGMVRLWSLVGKDGTVKHVEVIAGPSLFQKPAIAAMKKRRYEPSTVDGVPVEALVSDSMSFHL